MISEWWRMWHNVMGFRRHSLHTLHTWKLLKGSWRRSRKKPGAKPVRRSVSSRCHFAEGFVVSVVSGACKVLAHPEQRTFHDIAQTCPGWIAAAGAGLGPWGSSGEDHVAPLFLYREVPVGRLCAKHLDLLVLNPNMCTRYFSVVAPTLIVESMRKAARPSKCLGSQGPIIFIISQLERRFSK